jgi:NodT family efflux transporter outer membrane factor (OMF) lipoprotein
MDAPAQWQAGLPAGPGQLQPWWRNFGDPALDGLLDQGLERNGDLRMAAMRLQRAELQAALVATSQWPTTGANVSTSLARTAGLAGTARSTTVVAALSYEVDLWGKLSLQRDQAAWEHAATAADCQAVALVTEGAVANAWWTLAWLNRLVANADAGIAYSQRTLEIVRARHAAGAVSGGDPAQAEQVLAARRASRTGLLQRRTEVRHALAVLLDRSPGAALPERADLPESLIPAVEAGLPAALLSRRPDLRSAESRLRASQVQVDLVRVSYYPVFSLTGSLGGSSEALIEVLRHPASVLGANLLLPFTQGHTPALAEGVARTQYGEALAGFRQQWLGALAEVEDRLSARAQLQEEAGHLMRAMEQANLAEQHAETRYRAGASAAQSWLDTQQTLRNAEDLVAGNRYNQLVNMVRLYQALGGDRDTVLAGCRDPLPPDSAARHGAAIPLRPPPGSP